MVSGHLKSIRIPWVDEFSTGPLDLGHHNVAYLAIVQDLGFKVI